MAKKIYLFSGLGADERVFQKMDFSGFSVIYIKWIMPEKEETIENYANKLLIQIDTENPILIGLSFGGVIAIEVAKQIETEKVIILASAKTCNEIPFYFRWAGKIKLYKLLPTITLTKANFITYWLFGTTSKNEKYILNEILKDTDPRFLIWAIDKIANWTNKTSPENVIHIHGTADRILPIGFINCNFRIDQGGHFMTLNKAVELIKILRNII